LEKFSPPLDEQEVRTIASSATKSEHRREVKEQVLAKARPILDDRFKLLRNDDESVALLKVVGPGELAPVVWHQPVVAELARGREWCPPQLQEYVARQWELVTPGLADEPAPIGFKGGEGWAYCRLPFDLPPLRGPEAWPAWEEFICRLSDRDFFMGWLGSVFDAGNVSRQVPYLLGAGQDGKSVVLRVLYQLLGRTACTLSDTHVTNFSASFAYGHRLVVIGENKNDKILMTGLVRSMTSGDAVAVEKKGEQAFSAVLRCKLLIAGNAAPHVSGSRADMSRLVLLEVAESPIKDDGAWEDRLKAELPAFLAACWALYQQQCPRRGNVPVNELAAEATANAAADAEADLAAVADELLEAVLGERLRLADLRRALAEHPVARRWDNFGLGHFYAYLERARGLRRGGPGRLQLLGARMR